MHATNTVVPRPLDRLWLRWKPKVVSGLAKLSRKRAASAGTPRATSADMEKLHKHFAKGRPT